MQTKLEDIINDPNHQLNQLLDDKIAKISEVIVEIQRINLSNERAEVKAEALLFRLVNMGELFNDLKRVLDNNGIQIPLDYRSFIDHAIRARNCAIHYYNVNLGNNNAIINNCIVFTQNLANMRQDQLKNILSNNTQNYDFTPLANSCNAIANLFRPSPQQSQLAQLQRQLAQPQQYHQNQIAQLQQQIDQLQQHLALSQLQILKSLIEKLNTFINNQDLNTLITNQSLQTPLVTAIQNCVATLASLTSGSHSWILNYIGVNQNNALYNPIIDFATDRGQTIHHSFDFSPNALKTGINLFISTLAPQINSYLICLQAGLSQANPYVQYQPNQILGFLQDNQGYYIQDNLGNYIPDLLIVNQQLQNAIFNIEREKVAQRGQIATLTQNNQGLQANVANLTQTNQVLTQNNQAFQDQVADLTQNVQGLQANVANLTQTNQVLIQNNQAFQDQVADLTQNNQGLQANVANLTQTNQVLTQNNQAFQDQVADLTQNVQGLTQNNDVLQGQVDTLTKDKQQLTQDNKMLQEQLKEMQERLKKFEEENKFLNTQVKTVEQTNQQLTLTVQEKDEEIAENEEAINELKGIITEKDKEIKGLNKTIEEKDQDTEYDKESIGLLERSAREKDEEIRRLKEAIDKKDEKQSSSSEEPSSYIPVFTSPPKEEKEETAENQKGPKKK